MSQGTSRVEATPVGRLIQHWRHARKKSQLALALQAGVSARHLGFLEIGRANPSREMILLLVALLEEVLAYPGVPARWGAPDLLAPFPKPYLPVQFRKGDLVRDFFSTVTTLGTPLDVTLQEIRIECFFPADEQTARSVNARA